MNWKCHKAYGHHLQIARELMPESPRLNASLPQRSKQDAVRVYLGDICYVRHMVDRRRFYRFSWLDDSTEIELIAIITWNSVELLINSAGIWSSREYFEVINIIIYSTN